jgi:hypothetical protein
MSKHTLESTAAALVRSAVAFTFDGTSLEVPSLDLRVETGVARHGFEVAIAAEVRAVLCSVDSNVEALKALLAVAS